MPLLNLTESGVEVTTPDAVVFIPWEDAHLDGTPIASADEVSVSIRVDTDGSCRVTITTPGLSEDGREFYTAINYQEQLPDDDLRRLQRFTQTGGRR